jgi:hypothetical protein
MERRLVRGVLQLGSPRVGNEVRQLVRELSRLGGIRRVALTGRSLRLLMVSFDPMSIQAHMLIKYVRRSWATARLV